MIPVEKGLAALSIPAHCRKPIRASSEFKRSAGKGRGDGGKPAELNKYLGLREGDLKRLRGDSLIYKNGHCYVIVDKGKGGKYQEQRVCDKDVAEVEKFFDGSHRKLLIVGDFGRNFDYHGQRREYAMNICAYYTEQAKDPKLQECVIFEITKTPSNSINIDVKFRISIQNKIDKRLLKPELDDMEIFCCQ